MRGEIKVCELIQELPKHDASILEKLPVKELYDVLKYLSWIERCRLLSVSKQLGHSVCRSINWRTKNELHAVRDIFEHVGPVPDGEGATWDQILDQILLKFGQAISGIHFQGYQICGRVVKCISLPPLTRAILRNVHEKCPNLRVLVVRDYPIAYGALSDIPNFPLLETLNLNPKAPPIPSAGCARKFRKPADGRINFNPDYLCNLKTLVLSKSSCIRLPACFCLNKPKLQSIDLGRSLWPADVELLRSKGQTFGANLTEVKLILSLPTDWAWCREFFLDRAGANLKSVSLSIRPPWGKRRMITAHMRALLDHIRTDLLQTPIIDCSRLVCLELSPVIDDPSWLVEIGDRFPNLERLRLSFNPIKASWSEPIPETLRTLLASLRVTLRHLCIRHWQVTDEWVDSLPETVLALEELELVDCGFAGANTYYRVEHLLARLCRALGRVARFWRLILQPISRQYVEQLAWETLLADEDFSRFCSFDLNYCEHDLRLTVRFTHHGDWPVRTVKPIVSRRAEER